jgi:hypothetical protein
MGVAWLPGETILIPVFPERCQAGDLIFSGQPFSSPNLQVSWQVSLQVCL